jgi:hypothetical protein
LKVSRFLWAVLVAASFLGLSAERLVAQIPDGLSQAIRFRLSAQRIEFPRHTSLEEGGRLGRRLPPALAAWRWFLAARQRIEEDQARRMHGRLLATFGQTPSDTAAAEPAVALPDVVEPSPNLQDLLPSADFNLELDARLETRLDRLRNLNCTTLDIANPASGCQGGFPAPDLDQQFKLRSGGVISDRLHFNVDFDGEREFSANNTINVWYQGLEDEILRRVEVGNIDLRLPTSRFITSAVPANSFGIGADAQLGPFEFRSILAQQKGSSLRSRVFTVGDRATQAVSRGARDVEFEAGRFFFVMNPLGLPGFPDVDVLNFGTEMLPAALRVAQVRVYRLRAQTGQVGSNPNLGGIDAVATRSDSPQRVGPFQWELLVEGRDYYLDPSAAWFALANRVGTEEFLAVSYITAQGDTVGTFPSVTGEGDTLELIYEPRRGPEVPTYFYEMRNVYRIGGGDVSRASIDLTLVVNESERPLDGVGTYLSRLGLALSIDPSQLDEFNRVFPRERDPNGGAPVRDLFVVFPHLQPFADDARLQAGERNDSLYRTPTYLLASEGPPPRFHFLWDYEATGSGDRSTIGLGAIQVRDGSERITIGDRELVRGRDYEVSYDLGLVTFLNPDSLFMGPTQVNVQFEENQIFDVAPQSVLGLSTTYNLGSRGRVEAIGLFQRERTIFTRPQLGFEPQAMFMGGLSTDLRFRADWLTRVVDALPLIRTDVPSVLQVNGEVAFSQPNPNQAGEAYIEEFEGESARFIQVVENSFQLGSRPVSGRGLPPSYVNSIGEFDSDDAVPLVWQNAIEVETGAFELGPRDIDPTIVLTGASRQIETLLWLTLKPDTVGGAPHPVTGAARWARPHTPGPRWRSITQPLDRSGLGVDLSRIEFLEFWVLEDVVRSAMNQNAALVFDFGTVPEDAVSFGPEAFTAMGADTVFTGFQFLGEDVLDSEKDRVTNVFNAVVHDVGIHGDLMPSILNASTSENVSDFPLCERGISVGLPVFRLGDLNARCTRLNGLPDSEDLNGDNRLDVNIGGGGEDVVRFVFRIGDARFFVRTGGTHANVDGRTMTWRLFRIPFREDTLQIGSPNLRRIRSLRLTLVTPGGAGPEEEVFFSLARMKLVGAPWIKRAETPIVGLSGRRGEPHGEVLASIVSTENVDLGYTSPPGATDEAEREGATFEFGFQQINERSLRLLATDLRVGERAEALVRFADEADKNFLNYRNLRVWARGRGPGWEEGDLEFFIKVGRDENNFYLYKTSVRSLAWEPEVIVDIQRWLELRSAVETAWLGGLPPTGAAECGGDPTAFVVCDGPYMVHVKDPGVAPPNLARVSEVAVGMFRAQQRVSIGQAELWVDDIRLSDIVDDLGVAGAIEARLAAADFAEVSFAFSGKDDRFRQLEETPDYVGDAATRIGGTVNLDKLTPAAWGLSVPFTVQHQRVTVRPFYVQQGDVRTGALTAPRKPGSSATSFQVAFRRVRRGEHLAERLFLDPVSVTASSLNAEDVTELTRATTANRQVRVEYNNVAVPRTVRAAPGFLVSLVDHLPRFIRESEFGKALRSSRLRWNPHQVRFVSTVTNNLTQRFTFRVPVALPGDSALQPLQSVVHTWRNQTSVDLRPLSSLSLRADYISNRDLQSYGDSTSVGRLVQQERGTFLGKNVGIERDRLFSTSMNISPVVSSWLRPRFNVASDFVFHRDPNAREPVRVGDESTAAFRVPEAISNGRRSELGSTVDLGRLVEGIVGRTSSATTLFRRLLPADISFRRERRSTFDRVPFSPTLRYQLAFGDIDEFREQQGVPATSAVNTGIWTAAGGVQLPFGFRLTLTYRDFETTTWARRRDTQTEIVQRIREWPSAFVSWVYTPRWALRDVISSVTAQAQIRQARSSSFQPAALATPGAPQAGQAEATAGAGVFTENNSTSYTPSMTLTWAGGVVTTAQYSRLRGDLLTSGNVTRSDRSEGAVSMAFSFRAPRWLVRLPGEVRTSLALNVSQQLVCIQRLDSPDCSAVSDSHRQQVDFNMDTGFPPSMRGGVSFRYVLTDQRHTSSKFSQLIFTVFVTINFLAGQAR